MALTPGFKNLCKVVVIVGLVVGGAVFANKHNYFGIIDEKPKTEQQVQDAVDTAMPSREVRIPVTETAPTARMDEVPVQQPPVTTVDNPVRQDPPKDDSAINKLKGMDKL